MTAIIVNININIKMINDQKALHLKWRAFSFKIINQTEVASLY